VNYRNTVNNRTMRIGTIGLCLGVAMSMSVAFCVQPPAVEWTKTFAGGGNAEGHCVQQTQDSGFVVAGEATSDSGQTDFYLVKTDSLGNTEWEKTFSGTGPMFAFSVQQTEDGGYVLAGRGELYQDLPMGVVLVKTDNQGVLQWQSLVSDTDEYRDGGFSVVQSGDGGFVIAAVRNMTRDSGLLLFKTDSLGTRLWAQRYAVPYPKYSPDDPVQVRQTSDGGYIIGTKTLLKVDSLGNEQWLKTYMGTSGAYSAAQTADGGYAATGPADDPLGEGKRRVFLLKTDAQGDTQWLSLHASSSSSKGRWVEQTADGGYIVACEVQYGSRIFRTDSSGSEIWSETPPLGLGSGMECVRQALDGGYIATGYYYDKSSHTQYLYLLKLAHEQ
jgi:hypothetical protein